MIQPHSTPAGPPALDVKDLGKRYAGADHDALKGVDLMVPRGQVVAVVGSSGCGKTTLLRLIAGLEVPDTGTIRVAGDLVAGPGTWVHPEERGVGMVFQDFALFPHLRVTENVSYGLRRLAKAERKERTEWMLELVGLQDLGGRFPEQLSGGQQQRVALARALAPGPRLLLLDEPFSSLDVPLKVALQEELAELLVASDVPALLVVHDVEDVVALAREVVVLRHGCVVGSGRPTVLCQQPGDPYVAGLFERLRMPAGNRLVMGPEGPEDPPGG